MKHNGFSHSSSQLGDVASCTDTNTRNESSRPASPKREYMMK